MILQGDALEKLKGLDDNSVDSVVTDPPYGLSKEPDITEVLTKWLNGEPYDHGHGGFMGKKWDSFVPHPDVWKEVYRVLKPGGHALVFAGTRTQDLMTIALRLARFEVRDVIEWLYFSGFPKSHDVSKAFDRRAGAEREVIGEYRRPDGGMRDYSKSSKGIWSSEGRQERSLTAPATKLARKWDGWGTSLKPSHEPIIVVRKPLIDADTGRKLTVADCVEKYGTGAINIDASRIAYDSSSENFGKRNDDYNKEGGFSFFEGAKKQLRSVPPEKGRFPANCITLDSDEFYSKFFNVSPEELSKKASKKDRNSDWLGNEIDLEERQVRRLSGGDFKHNSGSVKSDKSGGRSRNFHPTVKPTDLMAWLVRLITPPNGTVLDPFAGSGSTLVAAKREGFNYIGIELMDEYIDIIKARLKK